MFSVGGVWCHASGMQLGVACVQLRVFIILSTVAALAVSLLQRQNGDGSEKKRASSLARKQ